MDPSTHSPQEIASFFNVIRTPEPIAWFPPAIGWWMLFAMIGVLILWGIWDYWRWREIRSYIQHLSNLPKKELPSALAQILKYFSIQADPVRAARLHGKEWGAWLADYTQSPLEKNWEVWFSTGYLMHAKPPKDWEKRCWYWLKQLSLPQKGKHSVRYSDNTKRI